MSQKVAVIGSINIDHKLGVCDFPKPGETIFAADRSQALGGKGANQAIAVLRAGGQAQMVGAVGSDGELALEMLTTEGLNIDDVQRVNHVKTGEATVVTSQSGENTIILHRGANFQLDTEKIEHFLSGIDESYIILLQNEISPTDADLVITLGQEAGATIVWNAAPAPKHHQDLLHGIDVLIVNETELTSVAELLGTGGSDYSEMARNVGAGLQCAVIATLGPGGAVSVVDGFLEEWPAFPVVSVDSTAAGDAFVGYFVTEMKSDFQRAMTRGMAAGSIAVSMVGAARSIPHTRDVDELVTDRSREDS